MRYINVGIPKSPLKLLTYSIPDDFSHVSPGTRVLVPLGTRFASGFAIEEETKGPEDPAVKPISDVIDKQNLFSPVLLELTKWIAEYYLAEWADVLKAALPPALDVHPETLVSLLSDAVPENADHPILQILKERKHLPLKEIYKLFGHRGTYSQLKAMQDRDLLEMIAGKRKKIRRNNVFERLTTGGAPETKKQMELYEFLSNRGGTA